MSPQPHQTHVYFVLSKKKIILIHGGLTPCFSPGHNHLWICAPQSENHLCCSSILQIVWTEKLFLWVTNEISFLCTMKTLSLKWTSYAFTYFLSYTNSDPMFILNMATLSNNRISYAHVIRVSPSSDF